MKLRPLEEDWLSLNLPFLNQLRTSLNSTYLSDWGETDSVSVHAQSFSAGETRCEMILVDGRWLLRLRCPMSSRGFSSQRPSIGDDWFRLASSKKSGPIIDNPTEITMIHFFCRRLESSPAHSWMTMTSWHQWRRSSRLRPLSSPSHQHSSSSAYDDLSCSYDAEVRKISTIWCNPRHHLSHRYSSSVCRT